MEPVICENMVWIAGSMTSGANSAWPAVRSGSLRCQKMKASELMTNTGLPLSVGPGAMMKSPCLKPEELSSTPCTQPPISNMPMSPDTKRGRNVLQCCAATFGSI